MTYIRTPRRGMLAKNILPICLNSELTAVDMRLGPDLPQQVLDQQR